MLNYIEIDMDSLIDCNDGYNPYTTGYGRKIKTNYKILHNNRCYRVYAMCYGNSGTYYILKKKKEYILDMI